MPNMKTRWTNAKKVYKRAAGESKPKLKSSQAKSGLEAALGTVDSNWKKDPGLPRAYQGFQTLMQSYILVLDKEIKSGKPGGEVNKKQVDARTRKTALETLKSALEGIDRIIQTQLSLFKQFHRATGELNRLHELLKTHESRMASSNGIVKIWNKWGRDRTFRSDFEAAGKACFAPEVYEFLVAVTDRSPSPAKIYETWVDESSGRQINVKGTTRESLRIASQQNNSYATLYELCTSDSYWLPTSTQVLGKATMTVAQSNSRPKWFVWAVKKSAEYSRHTDAIKNQERKIKTLKQAIKKSP